MIFIPSHFINTDLLTSARDTAVASSPSTLPQWWDMYASVLAGMVRALIPSELRFGMYICEVGHPSEEASAAVFPVSMPNVSGV